MERQFTSGNVFKTIIRFSVPFFLSYFLQTLYGMADLYIVGQFNGIAHITSVSVGSQVMHMVTVMIVGLAMGATVTIGQATGANKKSEASDYIGNTMTLFLTGSVLLSGLLLLFVNPIVSVMATPVEAVEATKRYLLICFIGIPFITAYNIISSILRGLGDSKSPMYFIIVACICNIGLDYVFIGVWNLGSVGAALGTVISQTISVIIAFVVIRRRDMGISLCKKNFCMQKEIVGRIVRIGIPVALQDGFIQIAFLIITIIANSRGLNDAAAVGIVEKIIGMVFLVPSSMLSTVSALAAQNNGAGKHERSIQTLRYAVLICLIYGIVIATIVQFCSGGIIGLFSDDAQVIRLGSSYIRSYIFDCMFAGVHFCFSGFFCAYGKSGISFFHNTVSIVVMRIPGAYFASKMFATTLFPMGLAATFGSVISSFICLYFFLRMQKKLNIVS